MILNFFRALFFPYKPEQKPAPHVVIPIDRNRPTGTLKGDSR